MEVDKHLVGYCATLPWPNPDGDLQYAMQSRRPRVFGYGNSMDVSCEYRPNN